MKVLLLGETAVGKTSMLNQYVNRDFKNFGYAPTVGADFLSRQLEVRNSFVTLQLWDTAGMERFRALTARFYRTADAVLFVFDLTNGATLDKIDIWLGQFRQGAGDDQERQRAMMLFGNKTDMVEQRVVTRQAGEKFASEHGLLYKEGSAKSAEGLSEAFEELAETVLDRRRGESGARSSGAGPLTPSVALDAPGEEGHGKCCG